MFFLKGSFFVFAVFFFFGGGEVDLVGGLSFGVSLVCGCVFFEFFLKFLYCFRLL